MELGALVSPGAAAAGVKDESDIGPVTSPRPNPPAAEFQ